MRTHYAASALAVLACMTLAASAWADKVTVLPLASGGGGTTTAQLDAARKATRDAVTQLHHALPSDSEMLTAQMAVKDGVADTSAEYRAAGRASGAQWTVAGHLDPHGDSHGPTYRLELEVCQVDSGRVESLAREVDASQATPEIAEMLTLLLRPEGIGNTEPPWERAQPKVPAAPAPQPAPQAPPPQPVPQAPPPQEPAAPALAYAEGHPFGIGAGIGVLAAAKRAQNARGSATAGLIDVSAGYALEGVRGLELRADFAAGVVGPQSVTLDAGARYVFAIAPRARLFIGPEAGIGGFFALGGDRDARLFLRGALPIVWAPGAQWQLELAPEVAYAGGGSSALVLAGATARAVLRF